MNKNSSETKLQGKKYILDTLKKKKYIFKIAIIKNIYLKHS